MSYWNPDKTSKYFSELNNSKNQSLVLASVISVLIAQVYVTAAKAMDIVMSFHFAE